MNVKFCTECGAKVDYKFAAPKFCASCGSSLMRGASLSADNKMPPKAVKNTAKQLEDGTTDSDAVPHVEKFQGTVEYDNNVISMGFNDKEGFTFGTKKFDKRSTNI
jgi:hypothetical protein